MSERPPKPPDGVPAASSPPPPPPGEDASPLAKAAAMTGLCAWVPVAGLACGPVAVGLGITALVRQKPGRKLAVIGLVMGILGPLIVTGLLAVALHQDFTGPSAPLTGTLRFQCLQCRRRCTIDAKELPTRWVSFSAHGRTWRTLYPQIDCPYDGCDGIAALMQRCRKCGKWFVPDQILRPDKWAGSPKALQVVCPHCGADQMRYQEKLLEEQLESRTQPAEAQ